jgi:DNA-directed RNA polymerase specialized sigma24 family protein
MRTEIEQFIIKNYKELQKICRKITKNSDWSDDLLNDVLIQLYDKEDIRLDSYDDNSIRYFIVRIICNNWHSKSSPFYRKVMRESTLYSPINDIRSDISEDNTDLDHMVINLVESEYGSLNWFYKDILNLYLILGSYKRVSDKTRIPIMSVSRYIKEAKKEIKINVLNKLK